MKWHRFSLTSQEAELMWDFSMKHIVMFHFIRQTELDRSDPDIARAALSRRYIYEGYMDEDTYLIFRIMVPAQDAE